MDLDNLHRRINKIIGQLNAIDRMIEEDIPCENILMQVNASKSALHKVGSIIACRLLCVLLSFIENVR